MDENWTEFYCSLWKSIKSHSEGKETEINLGWEQEREEKETLEKEKNELQVKTGLIQDE